MIIWDGAIGGEIHFATSFQYADGALEGLGEDFGAGPHSFLLHPDGIGYDRSSQVPEPSSSVAVAIALIGFVLRRHPRALRNEDDRQGNCVGPGLLLAESRCRLFLLFLPNLGKRCAVVL